MIPYLQRDQASASGWTPLEPETPPISPPVPPAPLGSALLRSVEAGARLASVSRTWSPGEAGVRAHPPPLVAAYTRPHTSSTQSFDTQQVS